jgi:uncharacterized membrane protein
MVARPDLRIGDADREASAVSLREHYAQGRLSLEEFNQRLDAIFAATTQGQLDHITRDLPHVPPPSVPLPVTSSALPPGGGGRRDSGGYGSRAHSGPRLGMVSGLTVMLAIWLVVVVTLHFRFPLPGGFSILLAGLVIVRSLLRRIFGGRRR